MSAEFTDEELKELLPAARAAVGGEAESGWEQLASFFENRPEVEPRPNTKPS